MGLMKAIRPLELSLSIIKPDICRNPQKLQLLRQVILDNHFYFIKSKVTHLNQSEAERFYDEHRNRFFYNRLITFMSSGLISVHILARENAITHLRQIMGPTHVYKAQYEAPDSIRARFGLTDTRNAIHGSDSADSVRREIGFFFPDFVTEDWYKFQEPLFRANDADFDHNLLIHKIRETSSVSDVHVKKPFRVFSA